MSKNNYLKNAIKNDNHDMVKKILKNAIKNDNHDMVKKILKNEYLYTGLSEKYDVLQYATSLNRIEIIRLLLEDGTYVTPVSIHDSINIASASGYIEASELIWKYDCGDDDCLFL